MLFSMKSLFELRYKGHLHFLNLFSRVTVSFMSSLDSLHSLLVCLELIDVK